MLSVYKSYWKNMINFSGRASSKELWLGMLLNIIILMITYSLLVLLPPSLENTGLLIWKLFRVIHSFPMVSLMSRYLNNREK